MKLRCLVVLILLQNLSFGQNINSFDKPMLERNLQKDSVIKDFSLLYNLINSLNPGQFMHCSKMDFDNCYDSLIRSIQTDLTGLEFYSKTSVLISKLKDGHASVINSDIKKALKNKLVFPFSVYKINDEFVVSKSGLVEYDFLVGCTVLKINKKPINEIVSTIIPYLNIEGDNVTGLNFPLQNFPFYYYLTDTTASFTLDYINLEGILKSIVLQGVEYEKFIKKTRKLVEPILQTFSKNNIAILTVNTFSVEDFEYKKIDYKKYIDKFFKSVHQKRIKNLIIDLRGNGGGAPEISNYLFSYLTNETYYYFDYVGRKTLNFSAWKSYSTKPQFLNDLDSTMYLYRNNLYCETETGKNDFWWFKKQMGKSNYFNGNLITIIDGGCFSTTGHFISLLKDKNIGKLLGECSQGSYYSNDGGQVFQLPYSKFMFHIPVAQFKMRLTHFVYDSKGICPDMVVTKNAEDFRTKYDRQLNVAIEQLLKM